MPDSNKPLVGIVCCRKEIERHPFHVVGEKYIKAIHDYSGVTSVLIPSDDLSSMKSILNRLDGFLLTGSLSNVHPDRYSDTIKDSEMLIDPDRDEYVFSAVKQIIDMELPILSICRGFQEMNVIFGGSLYQSLENESDFKGMILIAVQALRINMILATLCILSRVGIYVLVKEAEVNSAMGRA